MVIFTFKNLKFSELSKIRKLIHLSFIEEQKKSFSEKHRFPIGTLSKTKKVISHKKIRFKFHSSEHIKPCPSYILFDCLSSPNLICLILSYLFSSYISSFLFLYVTRYIQSDSPSIAGHKPHHEAFSQITKDIVTGSITQRN